MRPCQPKWIAIALLMSGQCLSGWSESMETEASILAHADAIVQEGIDAKEYPGATLVIGRGNEILWQKAYGHYTYNPGAAAVALDSLFDLASVSKVVGTATTAMALVEDGTLKLDDLVETHIEGFTTGGKESVRVRDLMSHLSGLKSYDSTTKAEEIRTPGMSSADALIRRIASLPASNAPRTTTTYSCLNMLTQARVNENVLQGRQDDFLARRVWGPLGMADTTYRLTPEQLKRTAPSIRKADGTGLVGLVHDPLASYHSAEEHCPGNAGIFSTAPDLAKFCQMIANSGTFGGKQVFTTDTIASMTSVQTPKPLENLRGIGWDIYPKPPYATPLNNTDGKRAIGHTGYTGTFLWVDMNTGAYVVFLTNRTYPDDSKASSRGVSRARGELVDLTLRSQPEYNKYFASADREIFRRKIGASLLIFMSL